MGEFADLAARPHFGGKTCTSIGLGSGTLLCNAYCSIVASNCVPLEQCSDGKDNDDDGSIDCDDSDDCGTKAPCTDSCAAPKLAVVGGTVFGDTTGKPSNLTPSCNPASGSEAFYQFTSPVTDQLKLNVQGGSKLSLSVRTECGNASLRLRRRGARLRTLIDNFEWVLKPGTKVGTIPVPR